MKLKYKFEIEELAGSFCATPQQECEFVGMIRMNPTAKDVFELLQEDISIEEIIKTLLNKYNVDTEVLTEEVKKTVNIFSEYGIIDECEK